MERRYIAYNIEICLEYNLEELELKRARKGLLKSHIANINGPCIHLLLFSLSCRRTG